MLGRRVASTQKPYRPGGEPDDGAQPEGRPPAVTNHDLSDEQRRKAGPRSYTGKNPSIRNAALGSRNPARDELIGRGIDDRFPCAQKKSDHDEHEERA